MVKAVTFSKVNNINRVDSSTAPSHTCNPAKTKTTIVEMRPEELVANKCGTHKNVQFQTQQREDLHKAATVAARVVREAVEGRIPVTNLKSTGTAKVRARRTTTPSPMTTTQDAMSRMTTTTTNTAAITTLEIV